MPREWVQSVLNILAIFVPTMIAWIIGSLHRTISIFFSPPPPPLPLGPLTIPAEPVLFTHIVQNLYFSPRLYVFVTKCLESIFILARQCFPFFFSHANNFFIYFDVEYKIKNVFGRLSVNLVTRILGWRERRVAMTFVLRINSVTPFFLLVVNSPVHITIWICYMCWRFLSDQIGGHYTQTKIGP